MLLLLTLACTLKAPDGTCDDTDASVADDDRDDDGAPWTEDCDESDPAVHPGAPETWYDGLDQDCLGDDDFDQDADGFDVATDCDDLDDAVHPGASDTWYDGIDQDCVGDDDFDQDGDGFDLDADCDDVHASAYPGAPDPWYDGIDQDCVGDDDFDQDGDGFDLDADCDDRNPAVYPGAADPRYDGVDQDCLGDDDNDGDGDGFPAYVDCDDADAGIHPGAVETWYDGVDGDCAGDDDEDQDGDGWPLADDCDDTNARVYPGAPDAWYDGVDGDCAGDDDEDQDGDGWPLADDCDDTEAGVYPGAAEVWYDGVDQDCLGDDDEDQDGDGFDLAADCDDADAAVHLGAAETWYDGVDSDCAGDDDFDQDGDGHDSSADCDDTDPATSPSAAEVCSNGIDDDCDGGADEDQDFWLDADGDGWGTDDTTTASCAAPSGYVAEGGDCDDADPDVFPGAHEACDDGIDSDCDGADAGGSTTDTRTWWNESTATARGLYGRVFGAGDLDGDGNDDFVVTDYTGSGWAGTVQVFRGPVSGSFTSSDAWATWTGAAGDQAGYAVAAGDFDGDGQDDLVVGAPGSATTDTGRAYVVAGPVPSGSALLTAVATATLTGEAGGDSAGWAVANAGDTEGDGVDDLLVGAPFNVTGTYLGVTYLVRRPTASAALSAADLVIRGAGGLGAAVSSAGDQDGDGLSDVIIGAPYLTVASGYEGTAYVFAGLTTGAIDTSAALASFYEETPWGYAGDSVAALGDVDGDGWDDLAIGATSTDLDVEDSRGDTYILLGPVSGAHSLWGADVAIVGLSDYDYFGLQVVGAGDLDGDGLGDLVASARGDSESGSGVRAGSHFVFYGPMSCVADTQDASVLFRGAVSYTSEMVSPGGDLDGDGMADLIFSGSYGIGIVPGSSLR